jgi:hypothetical protein
VRNKKFPIEDLRKLPGRYRAMLSEQVFVVFIHNGYLFRKAQSMDGMYYYPVSDTSFVGKNGAIQFSFHKNTRGNVVYLLNRDDNYNSTRYFWKQDSLVVEAESLLESGNHQEALKILRTVYSNDPENEYIANYIKHIQFILGHGMEEIEPVCGTYTSNFGTIKIFTKNKEFFIEDSQTLHQRILPVSNILFMNPKGYYYMEFLKKEDRVSAIRGYSPDGMEMMFYRVD